MVGNIGASKAWKSSTKLFAGDGSSATGFSAGGGGGLVNANDSNPAGLALKGSSYGGRITVQVILLLLQWLALEEEQVVELQ